MCIKRHTFRIIASNFVREQLILNCAYTIEIKLFRKIESTEKSDEIDATSTLLIPSVSILSAYWNSCAIFKDFKLFIL